MGGVVAVGLLVVVGALGATLSRGQGAAQPAQTWAQVAAGLRPALDRSSANPCQRGDTSCFEIVVAEMKRRAAMLAAQCAHNVLFAQIYVRMTQSIRAAARAHRLRDPVMMSHATAWFAHYYFSAYDNWRAGRRSAVPEPWRIAFDAARGRRVRGLGNLLLGINAHVSRDLPHVVAEAFPPRETPVDPDYLLANRLIEQVSTSSLRELAARFDPSVAGGQIPLTFRTGRRSFANLITLWRGIAWRDGQALRKASAGNRPRVSRRIEDNAGFRAAAIFASTAYLPLVESSQARDKYCTAHG